MTFSTFLKNGAAVALATAMVVTAMPAAAREQGSQGRGGGAERAADRQGLRGQAAVAPQRAAPAPSPQVRAPRTAPAPVAQAGGRGESRGDARGEARGGGREGGSRGNGGGGWQGGGQRPQTPQAPVAQAPRPQQPGQQPPRGGAQRPQQPSGQWNGGTRNPTYAAPDRNRDYTRDGRDDRRDGDGRGGWDRDGRDGRGWDRDGRSDYRQGYRAGQRDDRQWDRRWRDDRRYDWNGWRSRNRTTFNIGVYYSPYRNYSYRRLNIGFTLGSLFYSNRYWINDPWAYRLPEVYGPYRWVRYYDDVLLVDIYSGEVVDVIHDFFW